MEVKELRPGNMILYDNLEKRSPPEPYLREFIEKVEGRMIHFKNGEVRSVEHCAGIPISLEWLPRFGLRKNPLLIDKLRTKEVYYVHQLQNRLEDVTKVKSTFQVQ